MGIIGRVTKKARDIFNEAGETAFANAGAAAYVAAAAAIEETNDDLPKVEIDAQRKALLRPDFGSIVDDVRIVFNAGLVQLNILGQQIGTNPSAQTFGDRLYFEDEYAPGDAGQLEVLAHELVHTQQYRSAGSSLWEFGKRYFREYYRAGLSYDDNAMEQEADEFAACFMKRVGSTVRFENTWRSTWDGGWSSLVAFRLGADTFVQAYSRDTGAAAIRRIQPNGTGLDPVVWDDQWTRGWTTFTPFTMGGAPHCLSYKASNGQVDIYSFNPGGNGYTLVAQHKWTTNWTSIMPFVLNGQPHYLAYKAGNGRVSIGRIDPGGVIEPLWTDVWSRGWSSFLPFVRNGVPHLLAYKESGGRVGIDRIHPAGQGVIPLREEDWGDGWTTLLPLSNDGTDFLTYRGAALRTILSTMTWVPGDGHAHVARVDNNRVTTRWCDQWKGSWKCATSFSLNGNYYTLFSGADGNEASISRVTL